MKENRNRKYPELNVKTGQYWVYCHTVTLEDGTKKYYVGYSKRSKCCDRWQPLQYKRTALWPYVTQYGWENIEHSVIAIVDDKHTAEVMEDQIIVALGMNGMVINTNRSGGRCRDKTEEWKEEKSAYDAVYYQEHKEDKAAWRAEHKEEKAAYDAAWYAEHRDEQREKWAVRNSTPEGKIYNRVNIFNYRNPDRQIETPKEARRKYIDYGYIPSYIKNDDLF